MAAESGTHFKACILDFGKFFWLHGIFGDASLHNSGNTGVRFADDGTLQLAAEFADQCGHKLVGGDTVEAYGGSTGLFQLPQNRTRSTAICSPTRFWL